MPTFLSPADARLTYFCPQPPAPAGEPLRLERFPAAAAEAVRNQIGPLANLRSSSGCAVLLRTDSPSVELHLARLRHHQLVPQGVGLEVAQPDGAWQAFSSLDLREWDGDVTVRFATGLERGAAPQTLMLWLPLISTCAVTGVSLADGCIVERAEPPVPRWLAIGDSITQGFSVQCPTQGWVHRLMRRWDLPAWNLGVGGVKIEPGVFSWALGLRTWDLVTVGLGGNHAWSEADVHTVPERAAALAELLLAGDHGRLVWILPGWKPFEEEKGPRDFMGVPLDRSAGERMARIRETLRQCLAPFAPRLELVDDLAPHDARYYPDGLHPFAAGAAIYADRLHQALTGPD